MQVNRIRHHEAEYNKLSDAEIRQVAAALRGRARGGEALDRLLPEAFGLVCVSSWRQLKMRPFDVQLAAGVVMLMQPFSLWLYGYSLVTLLTGTVMFVIVTKFPD